MDRNRGKYFLVAGMSIALMLIVAGLAGASQNMRLGAARQGVGLARGFGMGQFVGGLNLTDLQKTRIKDILAENRVRILQTARNAVKARLDLISGVQGAAVELANAQAEVVNLKTQILEQIKSILTADQLTKLQQRQQLREQRLQKLLDRLNSRLGG